LNGLYKDFTFGIIRNDLGVRSVKQHKNLA